MIIGSRPLLCASLALFAYLGGIAEAQESNAERAKQIIEEVDNLYRGDASDARMKMTVETPQYQRTLTMDSVTLGRERMLIRILGPKKDRGITTLKQESEMWNYFPKINKVIKVPPSMMMGSWMGSDFNNDDLVRDTDLTEEYVLKLTETSDTFEISLTPKQKTVTVWGRIDYVIDKHARVPISQTYFDDDGEKIRVMSFSENREFSGRTIPSVMEMVPLRKPGHRTVVTFERLQLNPDSVSADLFTLRNLKKRF